MTTPRLYIIGAPKCGTTSLATWLSEHPQVFLPPIKEPCFWSTDYKRNYVFPEHWGDAEYRALFDAQARAKGATEWLDASTIYLASEVAVPRILERRPDARFVVMLRRPVEMAHALHMEMVFNGYEDELDFERAWSLQADRAKGDRIPSRCVEPKWLQYRRICALGEQLERVTRIAPEGAVLPLTIDEMSADPRATWVQVLSHFDLDEDGREVFPIHGSAHFSRLPMLTRIYGTPPDWLAPTMRASREALQRSGLIPLAKRALARKGRREAPTPAFEAHLGQEFAGEVATLERLLGRPLPDWRPMTKQARMERA